MNRINVDKHPFIKTIIVHIVPEGDPC